MNTPSIYALLALVIGLTVRLLKSDTPLPTVPSRYRPFLALALGALGGAVDSVARGTPWPEALLAGFGASLTAMLGHEVLVEKLLGGREPGAKNAPSVDELARAVNEAPPDDDTDSFIRRSGDK